VTARRLAVDGAELAYTDHGSGQPIVLVHGGLSSGAAWGPLLPMLAEQFRVVAPDSRGHGHSTNPRGELSYPLLADDLAALIAELGLDAPLVGGWSDGGQVAAELAVRHPRAAGALVIGGAHPDFVGSGLREVHRGLLGELDGDADDELHELVALHDDWPALLRQTAGMWLGYDGLDAAQIAAVAVPTLVLAADRDEVVGLDLAVDLFRRLPDAELAVVPGARHESPAGPERGPLFAALITDFARRRACTPPGRAQP
jgi:pimeloyl-ACP methyl ester carboxylesterase